MFDVVSQITHVINTALHSIEAAHNLIPHIEAEGASAAGKAIKVFPLLSETAIFLGCMAAVVGVALALAAKKFFVKTDPLVEAINEALAHAHCGACGYAGCEQYAEAVAHDPDVPPNLCTPGGSRCTEQVARLTNKVPEKKDPLYARVLCQGGNKEAARKITYLGMLDCRAAVITGGGDKSCAYGCLGYGTCVRVCPFGALSMSSNGLPVVDTTKCTGCRKCQNACPKKVIEVLPSSAKVLVACHSKDKGALTRKNCTVGCIGCGKCAKVCPTGAASVVDNLGVIDQEKCISCGLCVINCPTHAIVDLVEERGKARIKDNCIGCTLCSKACPVTAISGELKQLHRVDPAVCIGCGICTAKCPVTAIEGTFNLKKVLKAAEEKKKKKAQAQEAAGDTITKKGS
jgi:Na+-translocating ferredoxin:NAD+ oxidoreductase subunit B